MPTRFIHKITIFILIFMLNYTIMTWTGAMAETDIIDSFTIAFSHENQKLTVHVDEIPLRETLQMLANRLSVTISLIGFEGDNRLSVGFTDFPLEQGIEKLLHGQDYALIYSHAGSSQQTFIKEIIVLPRQSPSIDSNSSPLLVMSPMNNDQALLQGEKQRSDMTLAFDEFANNVEAILQSSEQNREQRELTFPQTPKEQDLEIQETGRAILEQFNTLEP